MLKNECSAPEALETMSDDALLTYVVNHLADRSDRLQQAEFDLATPVITVLSGRVSQELRLAAAETLRATGTIPATVFAALALPMEPDAPAMEARPLTPARLLALARQPEVPEAQSNLIVARGVIEALVAVAANPGARFAKSSLTTLVELAASDFSLREALCGRGDLPDAILDRLWPYLSPRGKARVIAAGLSLDAAAADALIRAAEQDLVATIRDGELPTSLDTCQTRIAEGALTLAEAIRLLAAEARFVDVAALLARPAGIGTPMALALLLGAYDRGCVALARAAGADGAALTALMEVRARAGGSRTPDRRGPVHAFTAMGAHEAADLLRALSGPQTPAPGTASLETGPDASDQGRIAA